MFEDPKWKPIYIKRQWHKRRRIRRKEQMKQITQKDLINLIKDKQENAKNEYERALQMQPCYEKKVQEITNEAYIKAYEDLICYIKSKVIVPEHIEENETLLDPLCNTCGKTKEECPFQRMGSAYEDCSGFEAPKQDMKVKIIKSAYYSEIENDITEFIKNKNIIDIKFAAGSDYGMMIYAVMIIYKEDKSEQEVKDEENKH